jgi:peroxiredoxin
VKPVPNPDVKLAVKPARYVAAAIVALAIGVGGYLAFESVGAAQKAPNVGYTLLSGQQGSVDQLRGKVVLVNFWATSCTTCMHEMPQIISTHEKFKARGYETLSVAMSYDPPAYVINYAETRKLPFSVAIDKTGVIAKSFGNVQLTPTSVLVNKRGEIVKRYVGEPDFVALHQLVDKLLAES